MDARQSSVRAARYGSSLCELRADDGVRFWVDDRLVVESWQPQSLTREVTVELSAGYHKLLLEHWDQQGVATIALEWARVDNTTPTPTAYPSEMGSASCRESVLR